MKKAKLLKVVPVLAALIASVVLWLKMPEPHSPELTKPVFALEQVANAKSLYFTVPLVKEQNDERATMFTQAARDPRYWRQLDRRFRFDAVVLAGDPSVYRQLLAHLKESQDWTLTYLDHTSIIYRRSPAKAWDPNALKALAERFPEPDEKLIFLVQAAGRLLAVGNTDSAKACLDRAVTLGKDSPELWTQMANLDVHLRQWKEGLEKAERALALQGDYVPALSVKAQILLAARRPNDAYTVSKQIVQKAPDDPWMLFQHARIAHAARAFQSEIEVLEKLVQLADKEQQSATGYRIYLGQAYAADGQGQPAIEQFKKALAAPDLGEEQRAFLQESLESLQQRTGQ